MICFSLISFLLFQAMRSVVVFQAMRSVVAHRASALPPSSSVLRCRTPCELFCPNVGLDLRRQQLERAIDDIFDGEAEMLQHVLRRGGGAECLHPDDIAVRADPSIP